MTEAPGAGRGVFLPGSHTRARGRAGEEAAVLALLDAGYELVAANVTTLAGELDLVARDGDTLCFVEVKARAEPVGGPAVAAVDRRKQRKVARAAALYLVEHPWSGPCRFDVVALDAVASGWQVTLVRDAFEVG